MVALSAENPPVNPGDVRDSGLNPVLGRFPWSSKWQPTLAGLPGEPHGQRGLEGYGPRGRKRVKYN